MLRLARPSQRSHGDYFYFYLAFIFILFRLVFNVQKSVYCELMLHGEYVSVIPRFKDSQSILDSDSYIIHQNGTLEISVAQSLNSGKYTCMASNNLGNKENNIYLEVKGE